MLVTVDVPCGHLAFALLDGICNVVVKLQAIRVPLKTSCKYDRHPFPRIAGMCRYVQFPRLQAGVESFD